MGRKKELRSLDEVLKEDFTYSTDTGTLYRLGDPSGTLDSRGYLVVTIKNRQYKVHRCIWFLHYGVWPDNGLDHIDRVKDNNRITNLRDVTQKVNMSNRGIRSDNKSGWSCVSWCNTKLKWCARKQFGETYKFMGYFSCPTKAYLSILEETTNDS